MSAAKTEGCRVVQAGKEFIGKQALSYAPGISAETVGAKGIHMSGASGQWQCSTVLGIAELLPSNSGLINISHPEYAERRLTDRRIQRH